MSKYCSYCGAENEDNAKFCGNCAKPFDDVKEKSSKKKYIALGIGILALAVVLFLIVNVVFLGESKNTLVCESEYFSTCENESELTNYLLHSTVLGSSYERSSIKTITFLDKDTLDEIPADAWDVSKKENNSVVAWVDDSGDLDVPYDLYIAGDGGVVANKDSSYLFAGYYYVTSIEFNDCFDTSNVEDMSYMFIGCEKFVSLDVSCFDTSKVKNMSHMFDDCRKLISLDLSNFNTTKVTDMSYMFNECTILSSLNIESFDTSNVTDMSYMFYNCMLLSELNTSSNFDTSNADTTDMYYGTSIETTNVSETITQSSTIDDSNYETVLKKSIEACNNNDVTTLAAISTGVLDVLGEEKETVVQTLIDSYLDYFDDAIGGQYTITYEITSTYEMTDSQVELIKSQLASYDNEDYEIFMDYFDNEVDSILVGEITATASNGSSSSEQSVRILLTQENGHWKFFSI